MSSPRGAHGPPPPVGYTPHGTCLARDWEVPHGAGSAWRGGRGGALHGAGSAGAVRPSPCWGWATTAALVALTGVSHPWRALPRSSVACTDQVHSEIQNFTGNFALCLYTIFS